MNLKSNKLLISLASLAFAAMPFTNAQAESINIYAWQNWSYEWVDRDAAPAGTDLDTFRNVAVVSPSADRQFDRLSPNAANLGFRAHMDTGIDGLQVGFRCEQFTFWGRKNNTTGWCNRNSKISLRHETLGEIMFGQWLLPYNDIVAGWIDPFYDASADSHTSIMGTFGLFDGVGDFYNGGFAPGFAEHPYGALGFNRRQEGIVQYVWPNTAAIGDQTRDGFQFRAAVTQGSGVDVDVTWQEGKANERTANFDPRIFSTGVAYQHNMGNDQIWVALAYQLHDDMSARTLGDENLAGGKYYSAQCSNSEDEGYRIAGRYKHDWGDGQFTWLAAMYEEISWDADGCRDTDGTPFVAADYDDPTKRAPIWTGVDRDAWMISGVHNFGNGFDVRFSYMDGDELECDSDVCLDDPDTSANERALLQADTGGDAFNIGLFYTMPAGTELRAVYSEINNDKNANYDFGINSSGVGIGADVEVFALGIVHWFD